MNNMPTYRRGRRRYRPGDGDARGLSAFCNVLFVLAFLAVPPVLFVGSEVARRSSHVALRDALESDIGPLSSGSRVGDFVHVVSTDIDAISSDREMEVEVPGALTMRRDSEYCQWQEVRRRECRKCVRTVRASDGTEREEEYDCDCVDRYDYVKSWRGRRINSMLFDQPAAHHNPQRDPMPSAALPARTATVRSESAPDASLSPEMLSSGVRGATWRTVNFVPGGVPPTPSFWTRWIPDRTRYEPTSALSETPHAPAARMHNFVYVGQGGYFFSPHQSGTAETLLKLFGQYLEGSIMDWQFGDLMPSCVAGDVRFRYRVQDPAAVSVLGEVTHRTSALGGDVVALAPRTMPNGRSLGLVHEGRRSVRTMIEAEDNDAARAALPFRLLLLPWAAAFVRILGALAGRDVGSASAPARCALIGALCLGVAGAAWTALWGAAVAEAAFALVAAAALAAAFGGRVPRSEVPPGPNAARCMIGRWANAPPEWRVEESYGGKEGMADPGSKGKDL